MEHHFLLNIFSYAAVNSQLQELNHGVPLNHWFSEHIVEPLILNSTLIF